MVHNVGSEYGGKTKIFEYIDTFWTALPLKERFFLMKQNILYMSMHISMVNTDKLGFNTDNAPSAKDS